jgi:hypothetical protein
MRSPCCLCPPTIHETCYIYHGTCISSQRRTSYIPPINLCLYVNPPYRCSATAQWKRYRGDEYTCNNRIVGRVVFPAVRVLSKDGWRLVLPPSDLFPNEPPLLFTRRLNDLDVRMTTTTSFEMNVGSYTSTPPYNFLACCFIKHRVSFTWMSRTELRYGVGNTSALHLVDPEFISQGITYIYWDFSWCSESLQENSGTVPQIYPLLFPHLF